MSDLDKLRELTGQLRPPPFDDLVTVSGTRRRHSAMSAGAVAAAVVIVATAVAMGVVGRPGAEQPPIGTPKPTVTHTAIAPVQRNGQITSAEQYLGAEARAYDWRSFDPVSETGLFVIHNGHDGVEGLGIAGPTGPVATLTCGRALRCSPEDDWLSYVAALGPGTNEVTVAAGDGTAQVIGYDGTLHRTLDLGATTTGGAEVTSLRWSPDGSRLAVVTLRFLEPECDRISQLWLVDQRGGEAQLAYSLFFDCAGPNDEPPRDASGFDGKGEIWRWSGWGWSPDGQTLLLDVWRGQRSSDVVLLHLQPDGAADPVVAENLYHSNRHFDWAGNVAWSPDGTRIAVRTRIPPGITHRITEISAEDGSVIAQHPDNEGWLIWPARQP